MNKMEFFFNKRYTVLKDLQERVQKNLIFAMRTPEQQLTQENYQEAIRPLGTEIEHILDQNALRSKIGSIFDQREQHVERVLAPLGSQQGPERQRLETAKRNVLNRLNILESRILNQLTALGIQTDADRLTQRHRERFGAVVRGVIAQGPGTPETPAAAANSGAAERSARRPELPNETDLFKRLLDYSSRWNREEIGPEFGFNFPNAVVRSFERNRTEYRGYRGREAAMVFLAEKAQFPQKNNPDNELKRIIASAKRIFQAYVDLRKNQKPIKTLFERDNQAALRTLRNEFFTNDLEINAQGLIRHGNRAIQQIIDRLQPQEVQRQREQQAQQREAEWQRQVRERFRTGKIDRPQECDSLDEVDSRIARGEPPRTEHLQAIAVQIQRVNTEVLNGQSTLSWNDTQVEASDGNYNPGSGMTRPPDIRVAGQRIPLTLTYEPTVGRGRNRPLIYNSIQRENHTVDVNLPRLLATLQNLRTFFPELTRGNAVRLGELAQQNPERLREQLHKRRYQLTLDTIGIQDKDAYSYENVPIRLVQLLDVSNQNQQKTPQQWVDQIEALQIHQHMPPDQYKFLWMMRSYVRTRQITEMNTMNLTEFSQKLLSSTTRISIDHIAPKDLPTTTQLTNTSGTPEAVLRNNQMGREYREYLNIEGIKQLHDFQDLLKNYNFDPHLEGALEARFSLKPWPDIVRWLQLGAETPLTTVQSGVRYVVYDHTEIQASVDPQNKYKRGYIPEELVEKYKELYQNNIFFRDLAERGLELWRTGKNGSNDRAYQATYEVLVNQIYTPEKAVTESASR